MKHLSIYAGVLTLTLCSAVAHATESSQVAVTGQITPAIGCTPKLSTSQLDFGDIAASTLNRDGPTFLPGKPMTLTIDCQAPAQLYLTFIDHQSDDAVSMRHPRCKDHPICEKHAMGLGQNEHGQNIGALYVFDGHDSQNGEMDGKTYRWWGYWAGNQRAMATLLSPREPFGSAGQTINDSYQPAPMTGTHRAKRFVLPFDIAPAIDSQHLSVTDEIKLNGALTLEMQLL